MSGTELHVTALDAVLVVAISAPPSTAVIDEVEAGFARLLDRCPEGGFLVVVRALPEGVVARRPGRAVRARVLALVRRAGPRLRGVAYVLPRAGFTSAIVRTAIGGMLRAAPFPARLFAAPEDAVAWICAQGGHRADARELLTTMRAARARLSA